MRVATLLFLLAIIIVIETALFTDAGPSRRKPGMRGMAQRRISSDSDSSPSSSSSSDSSSFDSESRPFRGLGSQPRQGRGYQGRLDCRGGGRRSRGCDRGKGNGRGTLRDPPASGCSGRMGQQCEFGNGNRGKIKCPAPCRVEKDGDILTGVVLHLSACKDQETCSLGPFSRTLKDSTPVQTFYCARVAYAESCADSFPSVHLVNLQDDLIGTDQGAFDLDWPEPCKMMNAAGALTWQAPCALNHTCSDIQVPVCVDDVTRRVQFCRPDEVPDVTNCECEEEENQGDQEQMQGQGPGQEQLQGQGPGQEQFQGQGPRQEQFQGYGPGQEQFQGYGPGQEQLQGYRP